MEYSEFIAKHAKLPEELYLLGQKHQSQFAVSQENELYNKGTMQRDADVAVTPNIFVTDAKKIDFGLRKYKILNPVMSEQEAQARVVFDFMQRKGSIFSYEKNANDILFSNVNRQMFYSQVIYLSATGNTNYFCRHVGNMQIITLPENKGGLPRNTEGISERTQTELAGIPIEELKEIFLKRGLYHEIVHAALGTSDERKCDAFAVLRTMKEHPQYSQTIFDLYNVARSKIGFTVTSMHNVRDDEKHFERQIKNGTMTYLMPNTYKKLHEYALNPQKIPDNDKDLLALTYEISRECEFLPQQLEKFNKLLKQEQITKEDLNNSEVVRICMQQGGFRDIDTYFKNDKKLRSFVGGDIDTPVRKEENVMSEKSMMKGALESRRGRSL